MLTHESGVTVENDAIAIFRSPIDDPEWKVAAIKQAEGNQAIAAYLAVCQRWWDVEDAKAFIPTANGQRAAAARLMVFDGKWSELEGMSEQEIEAHFDASEG
jgi:hypothetical protein